MIKLRITIALCLLTVLTFAQDELVLQDSVYQPDNEIAANLDSLIAVSFFDTYGTTYDSVMASMGIKMKRDSLPQVSDSLYAERLKTLDQATPFHLANNKHVRSYIKLYTERRRELSSRILGLADVYFPLFEEKLDAHDLPLEFKYLAIVESALNPTARSRSGASGLWQFMYRTGKMFGLSSNSYVDERRDPYLATEAACKYFRHLYKIYENWELVLAAYNCGPGNVNRAIRRSGGKKEYWALWPYLPRETRGYVPAFIAVNYMMNYSKEHELFAVAPKTTFFEFDSVMVNEEVSFEQISAVMNVDLEELRYLNPMYKRDFIPYAKDGRILALPNDKVGAFLTNDSLVYAYNKAPDAERIEPEEVKEVRTTHIVRSGDVLGKIANRYGVSVNDIRDWNNLRGSRIYKGQRLLVYQSLNRSKKRKKKSIKIDPNATYYTMQSGDTLWDIAKAQGMSVNSLKRMNTSLNFKRIKPGTKIKISEGA